MLAVQIAYKVKFRAWGVTFGTIADVKTFPLPPALHALGPVLHAHELGRVDDRGVQIIVTLVDKP